VGPNGSGKSNVVESIRFVLGEQSMKSLRGKGGTDLIFKGSKNLGALSRASVTIVFDNTNNIFNFGDSRDTNQKKVSFNEVRITREVYADGSNRYLINGTEVRLKDIIELLASVHIGASGHHIISQGEADRILSSNARDRRVMIEDALGLKIYQFRIKESERRLEKTEINMKEVSALKRELAPHLAYLKKQVEKIEKTQSLRIELKDLYQMYGSAEQFIINSSKKDIHSKKVDLENKFKEVEEKVASHTRQKESTRSLDLQSKLDKITTDST
jgi:chromosome segregation protein